MINRFEDPAAVVVETVDGRHAIQSNLAISLTVTSRVQVFCRTSGKAIPLGIPSNITEQFRRDTLPLTRVGRFARYCFRSSRFKFCQWRYLARVRVKAQIGIARNETKPSGIFTRLIDRRPSEIEHMSLYSAKTC